jgi:branched-chain amino acid transport system permease protein
MSTYLEFAVLGFAAGATYVALAVGLIAVYRATGILNFAQGAMIAWGVYVYARLRTDGTLVLPVGQIGVGVLGLWPALIVGLTCCAVVGLLSHVLVFRPLRAAPPLAQIAASVGLMIVMQALVVLRFGTDLPLLDSILPAGSTTLLGARLSVSSLYLAGVAIAVAAIAWAYFRFTWLGIATRAGAVDEQALRLMGHSPDRLAAIVWAASLTLGGLVLTLASPSIGLNPTIYTYAIVPALAVALVGRLTSIPAACVGGLALGSFQAIVTLLTAKPWWPEWAVTGAQDAVPFLVIMVVLFVAGRKIPARGSLGQTQLPKVTIPQLRALPAIASIALAAGLLIVSSGSYRFALVTSLIMALLALSYVLLTGFLGQISLAQMALAGVAGFVLSKITTSWGIPFPLSIAMAAASAGALGVVVGLPATRIRGAQLAVVTLAFAVVIQEFVLRNPRLTPLDGNLIEDPQLLGINFAVREGTDVARLPFCLMVLAVVALVMFFTARLMRGDTGRAFLAVRSNERAAAAAGIDVRRCKLIGFGLAAVIAGVAGSLIGYSRGQLSSDSFTALAGLSLLAVAYLGGIGSLSGAVIAGLMGPLGVGYVFMNDTLSLGKYYYLVAGLGLIVTAIFNPLGIAGAPEALRARRRAAHEVAGARAVAPVTAELTAVTEKGATDAG